PTTGTDIRSAVTTRWGTRRCCSRAVTTGEANISHTRKSRRAMAISTISRPPENAIAQEPTWEGSVEELRGLVSERALTGETMLLNLGPHHPSTHGVLRLLLELDGEEIVTCLPDVG